jgi:hypothetical protein
MDMSLNTFRFSMIFIIAQSLLLHVALCLMT